MPWTSDLRSQETLPAIVNRMAKADPHKNFLRTVDGASATWDQLQEAMTLWAARFLALDVKKGDVVVTLLDAGPRLIGRMAGPFEHRCHRCRNEPRIPGPHARVRDQQLPARTPHRGGTIPAVRGGRRRGTAIGQARPRSGC